MKYVEFKILSESYSLIPVYEIITADLLTPVLAYLKIRKNGEQSFLLESVEGSTKMARYSFIGIEPEKIISNIENQLTLVESENTEKSNTCIFSYLKSSIGKTTRPSIPELPDFTGGFVGYIGYQNISLIEQVIKFNKVDSKIPDSILGYYNNILAFDHYKHQIILISNVHISKETDKKILYEKAKMKIELLKKKLSSAIEYKSDFRLNEMKSPEINMEDFGQKVKSCKEKIIEGDIFQIVLSEQFSAKYTGDSFNVYRALRIINPSPYMYFLEFDEKLKVIGTSPEDLLKIKDSKAQVLPIAGTRKRGNTKEEENKLEKDLLNDPKELAEHTMLLDLGRNDLGRVCKYGSIKVTERMKIQKYSHVIHLVSKVEGKLSKDKDSIDALKSCFPAGTVTGAPKIKAIQLINEYEKASRNIYAGAVGYIDFSGNLDMCIAIRTLFTSGEKIYWQAGAGIVADSKTELEAKEIKNKSEVMYAALKYAEVIDENTGY